MWVSRLVSVESNTVTVPPSSTVAESSTASSGMWANATPMPKAIMPTISIGIAIDRFNSIFPLHLRISYSLNNRERVRVST